MIFQIKNSYFCRIINKILFTYFGIKIQEFFQVCHSDQGLIRHIKWIDFCHRSFFVEISDSYVGLVRNKGHGWRKLVIVILAYGTYGRHLPSILIRFMVETVWKWPVPICICSNGKYFNHFSKWIAYREVDTAGYCSFTFPSFKAKCSNVPTVLFSDSSFALIWR